MFRDLQCIIEISGLAIRDLRIKTFVGYGSVGSKSLLFHLAKSHIIQECLLPFSSLSISLFITPSLEIVKAENFQGDFMILESLLNLFISHVQNLNFRGYTGFDLAIG